MPNLNGGFLCVLACMFCTPAPAMPGTVTLEKYQLTYLYTVNPTTCEQDYTYTCYTDDSYTLAVQYIDGDVSSFQGCVTLDFQGVEYWENSNGKGYKLHGCRIAGFVHNPTPITAPYCKAACSGGGTTTSGSQIYDDCWDADGRPTSQSCFNCMGPASGSSQNCPSQCWAAGPCSVWGNYPGVSDSGAMSCKQGCVFYCPYKTYGKPWVPSGIVAGEPSDWANTAADQMDCRAWPENFYYEASKNYYNPSTTYNKCAAGYYKSARGVPGQAFVSDCYECPQADVEVSSDVSGKNDIFSCYIPRNTEFSDESGSGHYVDNCDY